MKETINKIILRSKKKIQHLTTERVLCFTIDAYGDIISGRTISKNNKEGSSVIDLYKFYDMVESERACYVVLVHNHPRNTLLTSKDDDDTTENMKKICRKCGVKLYDHLIILKDYEDVYSYREEHRIVDKQEAKLRRKER